MKLISFYLLFLFNSFNYKLKICVHGLFTCKIHKMKDITDYII